jgi:hypothetical protein
VEGIRLAPQPGGTISGRLRLETAPNSQVKPDPGQMFLMLHSSDSDDEGLASFNIGSGFSPLAQVNANGTFEWKNVPAGNYFVQLSDASSMPAWFLKSVAVAGRDATESGLNVSGGSIALDLLVSANGAIAEGVVLNQKNEPVSNAIVVAVPDARFRSHPDRYRKTSADQSGRFTLRSLPPGDYTLFAWESIDGEAYLDPEFLKSYEDHGNALHVSEGGHMTLQLKVIGELEAEN